MPHREQLKPGRGSGSIGLSTKTPTTNTGVDSHAALPPGTLRGPFLDRQGDEHRQPSAKERRALKDIQRQQQDGGKP